MMRMVVVAVQMEMEMGTAMEMGIAMGTGTGIVALAQAMALTRLPRALAGLWVAAPVIQVVEGHPGRHREAVHPVLLLPEEVPL